jgi:hypothetical protein
MFIRAVAFLLVFAQVVLAQQPTPILPDPKLTPGDAFDVTVNDICVPGYTKKVRNVPAEMKCEVYREYGITSHESGDYEVDHLSTRTRRFQFYQKSLAGVPSDLALECAS